MFRLKKLPLFFILFLAIFLISHKNLKTSNAQTAPVCGEAPSDVVIVIDRSGSMTEAGGTTGTKLSNAKSSAKRFIDILSQNPKNRAGLSSFSTEGTMDALVSNNWTNIKTEITSLTAGGDTCAECGIYKGNLNLHQNGRAGVKKVMIFLTDGRANVIQGSHSLVSLTTAENAAIAEAKKSHKNDGTIIFTIGLGNNINASFLKEIASATGGRYYASPTTDELNNIYDKISQIIAKGTISGIVFNDLNENSVWDNTEPGIQGWNIQLIKPDSTTVNQSTSEKGTYLFGGLCDGAYTVKQSVISSYEQTFPTNNNYYTLTIADGKSFIDTNFGNKEIPVTPPPSCVEALPTLTIDPTTASGGVGETKTFVVTITNNDSSACQPTSILPSAYVEGFNWDFEFENTDFIFNPGESKNIKLQITPFSEGVDGVNTITVSIQKPNNALVSKNITFNLDNPVPTAAPTPLPTGAPDSTFLNLIIGADGIGKTKKIPIGGNPTPLHPFRNLTVKFYNASTNQLAGIPDSINFTFDPKIQKFQADVDFPNSFESGIYNIYVEGPQYLRGKIANSVTINKNQKNIAPALDLVTGDINKIDRSYNNIDLNDYNILLSCSIYSQDTSACEVDPSYKTYSDLDDNGIVDEDDFTLWLKEVANQGGAELPQ